MIRMHLSWTCILVLLHRLHCSTALHTADSSCALETSTRHASIVKSGESPSCQTLLLTRLPSPALAYAENPRSSELPSAISISARAGLQLSHVRRSGAAQQRKSTPALLQVGMLCGGGPNHGDQEQLSLQSCLL
jgi:hypothetical protein